MGPVPSKLELDSAELSSATYIVGPISQNKLGSSGTRESPSKRSDETGERLNTSQSKTSYSVPIIKDGENGRGN